MPKVIQIDNQNNDLLDGLLNEGSDGKDTKSNLEVLKELFQERDIKLKTELNINSVIIVNQKQAVSRLLYWSELQDVLTDFMALMVSKDREGRKEFVDAFKAERQVEQPKGFLTNLKDKLI